MSYEASPATNRELIILIGLQASGKSTFRRKSFDATHVVVSKDLMRNSRRPQRRQIRLIEEALAAGRSVVVDNTNPRAEDRSALLEVGRRFNARTIGYFLVSTFDESVQRNEQRAGIDCVPEVAIRSTAKVLQLPTYAEDFDQLFFVTMRNNTFEITLKVKDNDGR
jgi:predicted kinase